MLIRSSIRVCLLVLLIGISSIINAQTIGGRGPNDDLDGDGIINSIDIDDDNDGVLDADESPNCFMSLTNWNTADKTTFAIITSDLTTLAGYNGFAKLTDNDITTSGIKFSTTVAQSQNGKSIFKIEFSSPTQLDAMYIQKNDATQIFATTAASLKLQGSNNNSDWTDLTAALGQPTNSSYTTINGSRVITNTNKFIVTTSAGKYKYYRIYGIIAANILSGIANEFFFDINNATYQASYYPKVDCTNDINGDGFLNHQDLDSDGDGCSDALEAGTTTNTTTNFHFTGDVGTNGIVNSLETVVDNGLINYTSTYNIYAISNLVNACTDTDGDGIRDIFDLDDDNDGVLDVTEQYCVAYNAVTDFYGPNYWSSISWTGGAYTAAYPNATPNLYIDGNLTNGVEVFRPGTTANPIAGDDFTSTPIIFTLNTAVPIHADGFSIVNDYGASGDNILKADIKLYSGAGSSTTLLGIETVDNMADVSSTTRYPFSKAYDNISFIQILVYKTLPAGTQPDNGMQMGELGLYSNAGSFCMDIDTDGDGIPNRLDLDSDGDGCSDAIESGSSATATSLIVYPTGTDTNSNGILDAYESGTAGSINYTSKYTPYAVSANLAACRDTDGDGIPDDIDLDDDNDGILDAVESPECYYTSSEWHFGNRPDITVTSGLAMTSPQNKPQNLVDGKNSGVSYDVRFVATTAVGSGKEVYRFKMTIPVKLSKIILGYTGIYSQFNDGTKLILRGSNDGLNWTFLSGSGTSTSTAEVAYDATINSNSATETSTIYPYPATTQYGTSANIFSITQNAAKYQYYDIFWSSAGGINATGYANEVYFDVASDYNPSGHPKVTCTNDTDGDGILNQQDLDADGDGCPDAKEAGITATLTSASVINLVGSTIASGITSSTIQNAIVSGIGTPTFGNNGFANALETFTESGIFSGTYNYTYANNKTLSNCLDSDGDGTPDVFDLDDDNDGVLDIVECPVPGVKPLLSRFDIASGASMTQTFNGFPDELWIDVWTLDNNFNLKVNGTDITNVSELNFAPMSSSTVYTVPFTDVVRADGTPIYPSGSVWTYPNSAKYPLIRVKISNNGYSKIYGYDFVNGTGNYKELVLVNAVYQKVPINLSGSNTILLGQDNTYAPSYLNAEFNTYSSAGFCDTDGDGIENRLDLDSDNDGCSDAYEAKTTVNTSSNYKFTSTNNVADFGANGFYNALETITDNGFYKSNYTYDFAIDPAIKSCLDSDGDGVPDIYDLDDDNDGILDAIESPACYYSLTELSIPASVSSELNLYDATATYAITNSIDGLNSTYSAFKAGQYLIDKEILKYTANGLIDITSLTLDLDFRAISYDTASKFRFQGSADNVLWDNLNTAAVSSMNYVAPVSLVLTNNLQVGKKYKYFRLYGVSGTSNYGGVANATFNLATTTRVSSYQKLTCTNDTDGDGIPNQLDLDSDGDGCPDAKEAGVIGTLTTGTVINLTTPSGTATSTSTGVANAVAAGAYSANGFADALETGTESGLYSGTYIYDYAIIKTLNFCTDTDGDGIPDLIDIDDDNDGILDAIESPTCFYTSVELSQPTTVSTELTIYSTYTIDKAIDNDPSATSSAFYPNQNWIGKALFNFNALTQVPITGVNLNLTNWSLSNASTSNTFKLQGSSDNQIWTDLSSPIYSTATTGTLNIPNTLASNSKFKYFRIIGVAGVGYYGGVADIKLVIPSSFVQSQYTKPTCLLSDLDGDNLPNYLDLDSDGDGCSDALEAGTTSSTTANFKFTGSNTDFGANGFYNTIEKTNAESNLYKSFYTYYYANDATINVCTDTDGDGINDILDLDDDNDGVLDYVEQSCTGSNMSKSDITVSSAVNWYFQNAPNGLNALLDGSLIQQIYPTETSISNKTVFQFNFLKPKVLNLIELANVANQTPFIAGGTYKIQGSNDEGASWSDIISSQAVANTSPILATTNSIKFDMPLNYKAFLYYRIYAISMTGQANWSTEVYFREVKCLDIDTDGDGIPNRLDLDSDGDGCPDAVEAGTTAITSSGVASSAKLTTSIIPAPYGSNGFANGLETSSESGIYTSTYKYNYAIDATINACTDSDNDGVPDVLDLDDDNDGVLDDTENICQYIFLETFGATLPYPTLPTSNVLITSSEGAVYNAVPTHASGYWFAGRLDNTPDDVNGNMLMGYNIASTKIVYTKTITGLTVGQQYEFSAYIANPITSLGTYSNLTLQLKNASNTIFNTLNTGNILQGNFNWVKYSMVVSAPSTSVTFEIQTNSFGNNNTGEDFVLDDIGVKKVGCEDIDGDGIPNRLDLDSDGDGCPDAVEAGTTAITSSGVTSSAKLTTSIIPAPYGSNGFANGLETTTESGLYSGTYTYNYATDATINACTDSDNDGVPDVIDLDDDNDGVLDIVECPIYVESNTCNNWIAPTNGVSGTIISATGETVGYTITANSGVSYRSLVGADFWTTTMQCGQPLPGSGRLSNFTGAAEFTITFDRPVSNAQLLTSATETGVNEGLIITTNASSQQTVSANCNSVNQTLVNNQVNQTTLVMTGNYGVIRTIKDASYTSLNVRATNNGGGLILALSLCSIKTRFTCDIDNDGIPNQLDLDSDGDGCPDAKEAGVNGTLSSGSVKNGSGGAVTSTTTLANAIAAGPYGANGLANGVETATESGVVSYTSTYATNALVKDSVAPIISVQPLNKTVFVGGNAVLSVTTAVPPANRTLTYQWYKAGVAIAGANSATYTVTTSATTSNADNYYCTIGFVNSCLTSNTNTVNLTVLTNPVGLTACQDASAVLSVTKTGTNAVTYQWKKAGVSLVNGANIAGVTTSSLTLTNLALANVGDYTLVAIDANGAVITSLAGTITITNNTKYTVPDYTTCVTASNYTLTGSMVTGTSGATSTVWERSIDGGNTWLAVTSASDGVTYSVTTTTSGGTSTSTLRLSSVIAGLNGYKYRIATTNATCTNYSNAGTLIVNSAPTITAQPSNSVLCNVYATSFTAAANGANLTYKWQTRAPAGTWTTITASNASTIDAGVVYSNFATATLNLSAAPSTENNNEYQVVFTNSCGTVTSTTAILNPTVATPTITGGNISVCEGSPITLSTSSTTASPTYQWYLAGTAIGGATGTTYNPTASGNYSVIANATGYCKSGTASSTVTINPLPTVTIAQGAILTLSSGGSIQLTATASPSATYSYTWYNDGILVSGPSSINSYPVSAIGSYTVKATNSTTTCFANSSSTIISILPTASATGSTTICSGGSVGLTFALAADQTILWESSTDGTSWTPTGATSATYNATPTNLTGSPISIYYHAVISGTSPTGTTNAIVVTVNPLPTATISNTASGTTLCAGTNAILTAISGAASATYQWYNNNTIITGATASTYSTTGSGIFSFKVNDGSTSCAANSISSTVTVVSPPSAPNLTATSKIICINTTADLTVYQPLAVIGVSYEWHSASNTLSSTLVSNAAAVGTAGIYYLFAKNNSGGCYSTASVAFTLSIVSITQATLTGASSPTYTVGDIAVGLNASTSNPTYSLRWYASATGGVALTVPVIPSTATAGITNYYVEQYDANASFCTSNPRQLAAVTVKPLAPTVNNIAYCQNATAVPLTATPAIGGTLNWYGTAATGGTSTATAITPSTGTATNTAYYVSQTVNGVEGARAALTVTINAAPSAPSVISGTFSVTSTNSYTYSVTSVANTTYQWTLPSFMSGSSTTSSISALVNAAGTGTINVIAINTNGCLSPATTSNVISAAQFVAPPPTTMNSTYTIGDPAIPANTASQITAETGATLNYYTSNAAGSTSTSAQSIPTTAGVYTYYVSQTINGIESVLVPYTVTIKPLQPTVANITYCQNDIALALTATGSALQWYTVSTSGTATSTAPTPSTGTATSTTYYVTQTVNGVESDRIALVVIINPTPATPSSITGNTTTSTASSEIYAVTNDATATGYVWILPSGWTGTSSVNSITATIGLSGGQIKVKAINGACASPYSTITVDILNVTNPPLTTDVTFITGSTPTNIASNTSALITGTASTTINYYTSNFAGAASTTSQTTPTEPGVYTYYVSQTSSLGVESILVPYTITVKPISPPINTNNGIVGNAITYCKGVSAFALTAIASTGGTLKWYTVATGGASSNSAPTPSTSLVGATNYYVSQVVNGVESDRVLIVVTVNDLPGSITATATQPTCTNSSGYILVTSPLGTGFIYSVDGSNYSNTTLFSALPAGIYYATAKNNVGCVSAPTPITINTAVAPPLSPLVNVTQPTCALTTGSITILSTTLSTDKFSIDGGLNYQASKIFTGVTPGTYTVTTLNAGGCVSAGTAAVVNAALPVPAKPSISSSSASENICAGNTVTLTSSASIGNQWYKNGVLIAGAINQTYAPNASGNYTVIATNASGCSSLPSDAQTITFNPLPTPVIFNGATLAFDNCTTTVITLTASNTNTSTGNTYQWYLNGNSINVGGNNSTFNANAAGEYSVVITNNGCSTTSAISKLIAAPSVNAANTAFCAGGSSLISGISTGFVSPTYQWKVSTDDGLSFGNVSGTGTSLTYTATTAGKYQLQVTDGGIVSTSCPINVTVFTNPTATISASPSASVCVGSTVSLNSNVTSGTASYTYQWLIAGGNDILGAVSSSFTTSVAGSYAVKVTDANGCVVNAAPSTITFNAVPTAPVVTITNPTCDIATGTISVTSPLGAGYTYSIDGINYTNTTGLFTGLTASKTYNVTVKSNTGCTSNAMVANIAAALVVPAQPVITGPANVNPNSLNTYSVAPVTGATSYSWNIPGYWSGVSTTNTITIKVDASAGSLSVTANSASCVSIAATKNIIATILNPDVNATDINVPVSGKLTTNDVVPAGTTYGQPGTSATNPTGSTITVNADGSYTFTATTPGKYIYYVPVCAAGQTTGCPVSPLEITVLDPLAVNDRPLANNDMATAKPGVPTTVNILANDAAGNAGGTLNTSSVSISAAPKHGVVVVNSDGTITYTAAAGFIGTDSLIYNVCDNSSPTPLCQTAVVYFTVVPASAPSSTVALDDYATVVASPTGSNAVSGNVLTNDKNSSGASLTASLVAGPTSSQGTFTLNANGSYTYTPTAGFSGPVDIIYTTCTVSTPASCATATIHILVEPSQILNPDAATAYINIPTSGNISTNDVILPGSTYGQPAQQPGATITINADGTYSFTATAAGTYTYTVPVCAPGQTTGCPTETLVITVPVNSLLDNAATAYINIPIAGNISTNDTVPAGTTYNQPTQITGATITVNANGTYSFTATAAGTYTYTVPVCAPGQTSGCPTETLVISVPVNTIIPDVASVNYNETLAGNIHSNDTVPAGTSYGTPIKGGSNPSGDLPVINADGTYTFSSIVPGVYVFSIPVCAPGQTSGCPVETLTITVIDNRSSTTTPPSPILVPDIAVTDTKVPVNGNLTTNDIIQSGTTYGTASSATANPTGGVLTISSTGTYTFTATVPGKYIYYVPVCPAGQTTGCTISILEITVIDPSSNTNNPIANNDVATTNAGSAVNVNVLANDKAAKNGVGLIVDSLKVKVAPTNGTAVINSDGTIKYTPAAGFVGTDSLTYKICDSATPTNCQVAIVYFTVNPTSAAAATFASDDYAAVVLNPNGTYTASGNLLNNDSNTGGLPLTASVLNGPTAAQGTISIAADGSYTFTPAPGFSGPLDITYQACDNTTPAKCASATLHILVNLYLKLVNDSATQTVEKLISGNVAMNDNAPNGVYGTPKADANNLTGATFTLNNNGLYSFIAKQPGIYKYTYPVCSPGQTTNCDSTLIVFNITYLPQGTINLKYPTLLQADSVHLVFNFSVGVGPFKLVVLNSLTNKKDTLYYVRENADILVAPKKDDTKYTLLSITDSNNVVRDFNITKDTANLNILKPQILLTLKADLPNKLSNNIFKTKILMKVKNSGEIDLKDVQVNADLSKVFPADMRYTLDSFKVTYGNIKLNPNYTGFGISVKPRYISTTVDGFSYTYRSQATLSGSDLFDYGVALNINEEADVVFYFTLIPGKTLDPLVLQFSSVGNGLLVQNDGKKSMDTATALSHDNSNLLVHPDFTNIGKPLPTYIPLFIVSEIGAALQGSKADTVLGGYNFHYTSVIKNYSNSNLDSVFAYYNLRKAFPSPDTASIIGVPKVTGSVILNPNYDGVTDTAILNGVGSLKVGDSILIKYDVFVKTKKAQYAWPSYLITKGRTTTGDIIVSDSSTNGLNPDPNKDSIPNEHQPTIVYVGYNPPATPTLVSNVIYNVGDSLNPKNIGVLIKTVPPNAIPTWCDASGISCYSGVPSLPNKPGVYIYCVKSLDTLTGLTSSPCVMDTVTMLPVVKVKNDTLMSGLLSNPKNVSYLITSITPGSAPTWCDVNGTNCTTVAPVIPTLPGKYVWCVKALDSATKLLSANCKMDTLTILDPYNLLEITKQLTGISMNPDGSYLIGFVIKAQNKTNSRMDSVLIKDDLNTTFKTNKGFDIINMTASGGLIKNNSYDGFANIDLITKASVLPANKMDSVNLTILIHSADINGNYANIANIIANTNYGKIGLLSNDPVLNPSNYLIRVPTAFIVPKMDVIVPGGFSPNNDGIDDTWIIKRPFGSKIAVHVFNRWGNVVYENTDYNNDWRGKGVSNFMGEDLPEGTYFYTVEATDANGLIKRLAGSLTIVR